MRGRSRAASRSSTPAGIYYTPTTGIWQTVWLEPVPAARASRGCKIVPDVDGGKVRVTVAGVGGDAAGLSADVVALDGETAVGRRREARSAGEIGCRSPRRSSGRPIARSSTTCGSS